MAKRGQDQDVSISVPKDTQLCILLGLLAVTLLLAALVTLPDGSSPDDRLLSFMPVIGSNASLHAQVKLVMALCAMAVLLMLLHIVAVQWRTSHPLVSLARELRRLTSADKIPAGVRITPPVDLLLNAISSGIGRLLERLEQQDAILQQRNSEIRDCQEEFASVFEQSPAAMCMIAADGTIMQVNPAMCRLLGHPDGAMFSMGWIDLFPTADLPAAKSMVARIFESTNQKFEARFNTRTEGTVRCEVLTVVQYDAQRRPRYAMAHVTSLESCRRLEEALTHEQERSRLAVAIKDGFIATASYELRAPLTPAMLLISSLEHDQSIAEEVREELTLVREHLETEKQLINELLDVSAAREGKLRIVMAAAAVHECIQLAAAAADPDLRRRDIELDLDLLAGNDIMVGDTDRLTEAMRGIICSAASVAENDATLTLRTRNTTSSSLSVEIRISATSVGGSDLQRLLLPLSGPIDTANIPENRTGVELSLARTIIEAHDGALYTKGDGGRHPLTFQVVMPVRTATSFAPVQTEGDDRVLTRGLQLLVVEDDQATLDTLRRVLLEHGHIVVGVSTAQQALDAAARRQFDLVISDIRLPDRSGTDLMPILREKYGLRGIALTGLSAESDRRVVRDAGFEMCFSKPVRFVALIDAIQNICSQSQMENSVAALTDAGLAGGEADYAA